jgi:hypothetical protein
MRVADNAAADHAGGNITQVEDAVEQDLLGDCPGNDLNPPHAACRCYMLKKMFLNNSLQKIDRKICRSCRRLDLDQELLEKVLLFGGETVMVCRSFVAPPFSRGVSEQEIPLRHRQHRGGFAGQ